MPDDLRTRVAKAFYRAVYGSDEAWNTLHPRLQASYFDEADVALDELGLRREPGRRVPGVYIDPKTQQWVINPDAVEEAMATAPGVHRYVTDWTADE